MHTWTKGPFGEDPCYAGLRLRAGSRLAGPAALCALLALGCVARPRSESTSLAKPESASRRAERDRLVWHGERLREAGRHAEAAQAYQQALNLYPGEATVADRGHVLLRLAQSYRSVGALAPLTELGARYGGFGRVASAGDTLPRDVTFADVWLPEATPGAPAPITANSPAPAVSAALVAAPTSSGAPASSAAFPADPAPSPPPEVAPPASSSPALATTAVSRSPASADVVLYDDFRGCYRDELGRDVKARGSAWLIIKVGADGTVGDARGASFGLSKTLIDCLLASAVKARFAPPEGGKAVVAIPITFVRQ